MDWQSESAAGASSAELRQLLAAVASVGRAAGACLGKLCAGMAAKKKLQAVSVARGLEAVIAGVLQQHCQVVKSAVWLATELTSHC